VTLDKVQCTAKARTTGPGWRLPQRRRQGLGEVSTVGAAAVIEATITNPGGMPQSSPRR
jgi:hypothetical protein